MSRPEAQRAAGSAACAHRACLRSAVQVFKPANITRLSTSTGQYVRVLEADLKAGKSVVHITKGVSGPVTRHRVGPRRGTLWGGRLAGECLLCGGKACRHASAVTLPGSASLSLGVHAAPHLGGVQVMVPASSGIVLPQPSASCSHTVVEGDTLFGLATEVGSSVAALVDLNPALEADPTKLALGELLVAAWRSGRMGGRQEIPTCAACLPAAVHCLAAMLV